MKRMQRIGSAVVTASLCIALCACAVARREPKRTYDSSHAADVTEVRAAVYPEGIDADDYEAKRALEAENGVSEAFMDAVNTFSYKTASAVLGRKEENANYSPLSFYYALAIAASGAGGSTQEELLNILGVDTQEELARQCGRLYRLSYKDDEYAKLKIANSLWLDDEFKAEKVKFQDAFLDSVKDDLYGSVYLVDFSDPDAGNAMGKWIIEHTNGTLKPYIACSKDLLMTVINTVYFQSEWLYKLDEWDTEDDVFHAKEQEVTVPFMNKVNESQRFTVGEHYTRASLPLKGGSLVCVLPEEGVGIAELFESADSVKELFEGGKEKNGEVIWKIPKFSFDSEYDLSDVLQTLGVKEAFKESADFTKITDHTLFIGDVKQQTHIGIDKKGVEASAYTALFLCGMDMPDGHAEMILDRPFIFGIQSHTGALLFVGICNNPAN